MLITQQPRKLKKNTHKLGILTSLEKFDAQFTQFKNKQILLNKINLQFLVSTKLILSETSPFMIRFPQNFSR